jgi:hypothetical protein
MMNSLIAMKNRGNNGLFLAGLGLVMFALVGMSAWLLAR